MADEDQIDIVESRRLGSLKRSKALRYLFLRHLRNHKKRVDGSVYTEVANSLSISNSSGLYLIEWINRGNSFSKEIPEEEFTFYSTHRKSIETKFAKYEETKNNRLAQEFALESLKIKENDVFNEKVCIEPLELDKLKILLLNLLGCVALLYAFGLKNWPVVFLLAAVICLEFVSLKGKCISSALFMFFPFLGHPWVALIAGGCYGVLQFLDANPLLRKYRIILPFFGVLLGSVVLIHSRQGVMVNEGIIPLILISLFIIVYRVTLLLHIRSMPLVFPILGPVFYLEGFPVAGWFVVGCSLIGLVTILLKNSYKNTFKRMISAPQNS